MQLFSSAVTMAVVRTARCLRALCTTLSDVHTGFPRQFLADVGVLKELIGVVASPNVFLPWGVCTAGQRKLLVGCHDFRSMYHV